MTRDMSGVSVLPGASRYARAAACDLARLRIFVIVAGTCAALVFVVAALRYQLQTYGDGAMFSYAIAVQDAWIFHWRNIAPRMFVYFFSLWPAEIYVGLTGDAAGGIDLYGLLFYLAPLLGLAATFVADRSAHRLIFSTACFSTACLCPLVFGFPTELWLAHALFWPTLAACHYARRGIAGTTAVFALLLALAFTHEGALVFAATILATLLLRGPRDPAFLRAAGCLVVAAAIWLLVKRALPPDDYYAPILFRAAFYLIDITALTGGVFGLLLAALTGYAIVALALRRLSPAGAYACSAVIVAAALGVYWLWFDRSIHAEGRYAARTALLIATPALGALAAAYALEAEHRLVLRVPLLRPLTSALVRHARAPAIAGAAVLVMLVHAVETAKFVSGWADYRIALRALAMGTASDPALGDPHFVSSLRLAPDLNRLSWNSTTQVLSVLVAPGFAPARLVVDPAANYFWLICAVATANEEAPRVIPRESRRLVRLHACLHR